MTAKELYDWSKKEGKEDWVLEYAADPDLEIIVELEETDEGIVSLQVDPRNMDGEDYYGKIFDGKKVHYIAGNEEVSRKEYRKYEE